MMDIEKWDYETHSYKPYAVPDNVVIILYSQDMDIPVNCANCFKAMIYGDGYTSRTVHNHIGLGYPVCENCYEVEREQEKAA